MGRAADLLVVGAGPCGSFAALTSAKLGLEVEVREEHGEAGVPEHCPGHVTVDGLNLLGLKVPRRLVENEIRGIRFYSPSGFELTFESEEPRVYLLDRRGFDDWLYRQAEARGASFAFSSKVKKITLGEGGLKAKVRGEGGKLEEVRCRFVIDAEGCPGFLARRAGLSGVKAFVNGVHAVVERVEGVDERFAEVYFGRRFSPGFFAWVIPRGDGGAKVGLAARGRDPAALLKLFLKKHPLASKKVRGAKPSSLIPHPIPVGGPIKETFRGGLLVVGDAAGQVKPTSGGGLVTGLLCSKLAAEAVHRASLSPQGGGAGEGYQAAWKKALGANFFFMRQARRFLNLLSDAKLDGMFKAAGKLGLEDAPLMENLDFQAGLVKSLLKDPPLLLRGLRLALSIPFLELYP